VSAVGWSGPLFPGHVCSLGYSLLDWIHAYCCHGPGDVQGEKLDYDDEIRSFIIECYRLDPATGRRVYREAILSRPKGRAKSEIAGMVVVAEAVGPVRFDGWDADGQPVGRPVVSPLIKCLATEESQAGNTFENAAFVCGEWGPDAHPEVYGGIGGVRRYQSASAIYLPGGGEIRACTAGSASKDGGKETFVVPDESHLYVLRELREMYATVMRNLGKRKLADPWALQTTTAYRPGELSIAEQKLTAWRKGELDASTYVDHREAHGPIDIRDRARTLAQLREVYGPAMDPVTGWMDPERVYLDMLDPTVCVDEATAARYYLNRPMATKDAWIDKAVVERQARPEPVADGEPVTLGFDGSLRGDATVLIASRITDGYLFPVGIWQRPGTLPASVPWEVPRADVLATIRDTFARYDVRRLYADPHEWRSDIDTLAGELGEQRVVSWETRRDVQMAAALDRLHTDLVVGSLWHSGNGTFLDHFGNAYARRKGPHRLVRKEYDNSPRKIDCVVGAALAYEARADALTEQADSGPAEYFSWQDIERLADEGETDDRR
jgi:phage terminase large subunit-like protein